MFSILGGAEIAVTAAFWAFLALACIILYRAFRLRSLPWVMLYFPLAYITLEISRFYFSRIGRAEPSGPSIHSLGAVIVEVSSLLEDVAALLLAVVVVAEVGSLLRRSYPDARSRLVDLLARFHAHTTALGIAATALLLASPLPAVIYYYSHVHP